MSKIINVAVAVLHYQDLFLLGFRNANQHQGNRYEFIGGKIEADETAKEGLIREVKEEIGCDISKNLAQKMGVIRHDYAEKSVALHIFKIQINREQFESLQNEKGTEGQAITWVSKIDLLCKKYELPEANIRILDWLKFPEVVYISQCLDKFDNEQVFLDFYANNLPKNAIFYHRPQTEAAANFSLIQSLIKQRPDLTSIIQWQILQEFSKDLDGSQPIIHLNHQQLMTLKFDELSTEFKYFASCHDCESLSKINELAKTHIVMGCFLSPVKATPTHLDSQGMGWTVFGKLAEMCDVPVFALGGVNQSDLQTAWQHNAYGVAGIRLIDEIIN